MDCSISLHHATLDGETKCRLQIRVLCVDQARAVGKQLLHDLVMSVLGREMQGRAISVFCDQFGAASQQQIQDLLVTVFRGNMHCGEFVDGVHGVDDGGTLCEQLLHEPHASQHAGKTWSWLS